MEQAGFSSVKMLSIKQGPKVVLKQKKHVRLRFPLGSNMELDQKSPVHTVSKGRRGGIQTDTDRPTLRLID